MTFRADIWSHYAHMPTMEKMLLSVVKIRGMYTFSHKEAGYNKKGESMTDSPL